MSCSIDAHDVHLWLLDPRSPEADTLVDWLSADELARAESFLFERDRILYRSARGLARTALSVCAPHIAPAAWSFVTGTHGRPEVAAPECGLRFNVSHARDLVACVVTRDVDCGVDVDFIEVRAGLRSLADGVLTIAEREAMASLPARAYADRFFCHWTLKEAYSKARGLGLALPFEALELDPLATPIALRVHPPVHDDPRSWQLEQRRVGDDHWLAIAIRRGRRPDYRVIEHRVPLRDREPHRSRNP
jgi:4'-phosphopantetheinyl transferase